MYYSVTPYRSFSYREVWLPIQKVSNQTTYQTQLTSKPVVNNVHLSKTFLLRILYWALYCVHTEFLSGLKKNTAHVWYLISRTRFWYRIWYQMYLVAYTLGNKIFAQTASLRFDLECRAMGKWLKRSVHKIGYVKESRYTYMFLMGYQN